VIDFEQGGIERMFRIKNLVFRMKSNYYCIGGFKISMNRYEFYGNINTYRKNQSNKENELTHYGTLGQKWGVRKWQNYDGTFNEAGKERYFGTKKAKNEEKINSKYQNKDGSLTQEYINKIQKLTNEGKFDEIEKLKKQIDFDKVQEWSKKTNPNLYKMPDFSDPSEYEGDFESYVEDNWETAAKKRGFDLDDILTDEQYEIINQDMKDYFNSHEEKIGSVFNKNLSEEKKDKLREKLYSRDSEMLTIDQLYDEDEQKYLLNKKVSKKVNKLVDCLTKGDFDEYNKILEDVDPEHLQTVKNAAQDLANTKQLRNVDTSRLTEVSKDIFGNDNILGVQSILAMTNSDDINAHSSNRVYPVDIRQSIIDNSTLLKTAILEYERGYKDGYERDIQIASGGDERRAKYMKQFVDDVEAVKEYSKDSKEINDELRKLKTKESCDDKAFINYHYTEALYDNMRKYINDDFPVRLKKGTNDAKKMVNNLYKNFEKYSKEFKEDLYYQLLDYYDDEYISKSEFMKEIGKINAVEMYGNGNITFTYTVPGEMGYDMVNINGNINDNGKLTIDDADFID